MTSGEAIAYGNDYYRDLITACCEIDKKHKEFVKKSLKALEQESVLDKIRAEIEALPTAYPFLIDSYVKTKDVYQIIDKYKAESEDKE